jgi:hypothetical protein
MAQYGGFRLKIVRERGGDPENRGRFSRPSTRIENIIDTNLRAEAEALVGALREATPVYSPMPKDRHESRQTREGWEIGPARVTSPTGISVDILNRATAPGLDRVSLVGLLSRTGAQPHRIPLFGEKLLAFPWRKRRQRRKGKYSARKGELVYATHVKHPGFRALGFVQRVMTESDPGRMFATRMQKSPGAGKAVIDLMESGSFMRANPSLTRDQIKNMGRGDWDRTTGGFDR